MVLVNILIVALNKVLVKVLIFVAQLKDSVVMKRLNVDKVVSQLMVIVILFLLLLPLLLPHLLPHLSLNQVLLLLLLLQSLNPPVHLLPLVLPLPPLL